jgi:hypothetical protein
MKKILIGLLVLLNLSVFAADVVRCKVVKTSGDTMTFNDPFKGDTISIASDGSGLLGGIDIQFNSGARIEFPSKLQEVSSSATKFYLVSSSSSNLVRARIFMTPEKIVKIRSIDGFRVKDYELFCE